MRGAVYLDFDDVLCETARTLAGIVADRFGKHTAFEDILSFNLDHSFRLNVQEQELLFGWFHEDDVLDAIPPVPGAVAGVRHWASLGCRIEIVTGRPPQTHQASCRWLQHYGIPFDGITFVDKYGRGHTDVPGVAQMTLDEVRQQRFSLAVDDSPEMALLLAGADVGPVVLLDRPWNRALPSAPSYPTLERAMDWNDLLARFPHPILSHES